MEPEQKCDVFHWLRTVQKPLKYGQFQLITVNDCVFPSEDLIFPQHIAPRE